jgi:hypothetical protein
MFVSAEGLRVKEIIDAAMARHDKAGLPGIPLEVKAALVVAFQSNLYAACPELLEGGEPASMVHFTLKEMLKGLCPEVFLDNKEIYSRFREAYQADAKEQHSKGDKNAS